MVLLRLDADGEWMQVDQENKQEGDLYIDGYLKNKIDFALEQQKKDYDAGGIIVGDEGTGKSTFASNIMLYATKGKFKPTKHIIKDHEEALKVLQEVEEGGAIMFDEGYLLFYSADVLTKNQKAITKIFSIIRQKRLFFLIVAPSFFRLSTYFAVDRTRFLARVYNKPDGARGYFEYWGHKGKSKLFRYGKKKHQYKYPLFRGRFTKCSLLDEEYKKIKKETLEKAFTEAGPQKKELTPHQLYRKIRDQAIINGDGIPHKYIAQILDLSVETIKKKRQLMGLTKQNTLRTVAVSS